MKKTLLIFFLMCLGMMIQSQNAAAGDREWATTGKILTGVIGAGILAEAVTDGHPHYYEHHRPRHHRHHDVYMEYEPACHRTWVPGHYERFEERVWIPGQNERIWIEPEYRWEYRCGREVQVYNEGHYEYRTAPGHYETVSRERWIPEHFE